MRSRWILHLPWVAATVLIAVVVLIQGLVLQPRQVESARAAATATVRDTATRDFSFVQSLVLLEATEAIRDFISASSAIPGVEVMALISPEGMVLAASSIAAEGKPIEDSEIPPLAALRPRLNSHFSPEIVRAPFSDQVDVLLCVSFHGEETVVGGMQHGIFYERVDLGPAVGPVLASSRQFLQATIVMVLLLALPFQGLVYLLITRRLRSLGDDAARFRDGTRTGLFHDAMDDEIGRLASLLREAAGVLAEREEATQRLALAIESAHAGIWDWCLRGNTVHTSEEYQRMLGDEPVSACTPADDLLGRIHPDDARRVRNTIRGLDEPGNDSYEAEFRMRGKSSAAYRWIRSTGRVVERTSEGRAARMLGQHVDITAQKLLQARESDLARIVDESLNEIYIFSESTYRFLHANQAASLNLGYSRDALLEMTPLDIIPELDRNSLDLLTAPLRAGSAPARRVVSIFQRRDGSRYDTEVYLQPHRYQGEPAFAAIVLDISRRKEHERALRASEARFRMLVDHAADAVFLLDARGNFLDVNEEACRSTGYERGELLNRPVLDLIPRLSQERLDQFISSLEPGRPRLIESQNRRRDGSEFPVEIRIGCYDLEGERRVIALARDITERREAEQRIRLRDLRMHKFFEGVAHAISVFDRDGRFIMINSVGANVLGLPASEVVGHTLHEFLPDLSRNVVDRIAATLDSGPLGEWEERIALGDTERWFLSVMLPMENDGGAMEWVMVTSYDITRQKQSEESARAQEARYRTLVESTSAILWEADPATFRYTFVNQEAEAVLGFPVQHWIDQADFWQRRLHPLDRERMKAERIVARERGDGYVLEYRMIRADGSVVWLRDMVSVLMDADRPTSLVGVMIDITREKQEEERFQAAFESIPIGNFVIDRNERIQLANPAAEAMFGYTLADLAGMPLSDLVPAFAIADLIDSSPSNSAVRGRMREYTGIRKSREGFPIQFALGEMQREGAWSFVCSVVDLSQLKSLEVQLAQAQRMEAVGQLAGGVAHDFNNLLHVINGFTEIARNALPADAPVQSELEQIALAGSRAASLTGQLLAFSRRQVMRPDNVDLNTVIMRTTAMLSRVIGEHIRIEVLASPRLASVYADPGMIEQVLVNLCVNARDAMPGGGVLSIETENVVIDDAYSKDHLWANPGRYVLTTVTDTGCGMDNNTIAHIFEPFYTTKAVDEGTGLGLSMVYGIVKQHGGMVSVYSEVGKGTTFKVYLPQSERPAEDVGTKIEGEVPRGTETILVVEDDESVRKLSRAILEEAGYTVMEAENGRKALRCFQEDFQRIDLVLLDVVMPDLGGRDALDAMREIDGGVRAIFASGYSENAVHTNFVLDKGLVLLKKPYSRGELLRAVRAQLDGGQAT